MNDRMLPTVEEIEGGGGGNLKMTYICKIGIGLFSNIWPLDQNAFVLVWTDEY